MYNTSALSTTVTLCVRCSPHVTTIWSWRTAGYHTWCGVDFRKGSSYKLICILVTVCTVHNFRGSSRHLLLHINWSDLIFFVCLLLFFIFILDGWMGIRWQLICNYDTSWDWELRTQLPRSRERLLFVYQVVGIHVIRHGRASGCDSLYNNHAPWPLLCCQHIIRKGRWKYRIKKRYEQEILFQYSVYICCSVDSDVPDNFYLWLVSTLVVRSFMIPEREIGKTLITDPYSPIV